MLKVWCIVTGMLKVLCIGTCMSNVWCLCYRYVTGIVYCYRYVKRMVFVLQVWCFAYSFLVLLSSFLLFVMWEPMGRVDPYSEKPWIPHGNISWYQLDKATIEALKVHFDTPGEKIIFLLHTDPHPVLYGLELFCLVVFLLDLMLHFLACPHKKRYLRDPFNVDKVVINVSFLVVKIMESFPSLVRSEVGLYFFIVLYAISIFRIALTARLRKLYRRLDILLTAINNSCHEMFLLLIVFVCCVTVYGTLIFFLEIETDNFKNVGYGLWWSLVTMTTVGYGDFYPTTTLGYIVGTLCAINGIVALALPISSIAGNFSKYYSRFDDLERHKAAIKKEDKPAEE